MRTPAPSRWSIPALAATALLALMAGACGPSPQDVTEQYLHAKAQGDAAKAHEMVIPEDTAAKPVESLKKEWEAASGDLAHKTFDSKGSFQILETAKDGDKATVKVSLTSPDYEAMRKNGLLIAKAMSQSKGDKALEEELLQKFVVEKFTEEGVPMKTEEQTFNLVRKEKKWLLVMGWKEEAANAEAEARARSDREAKEGIYRGLLDQAKAAQKYGDFANALKLLEQARQEMPDGQEAGSLIAQIQQEQTRKQAKKPYLDGLRVSAVETQEMDTPKGRATVIKGKVTNATPQSFRVVTLAVDLLDSTGKPIERELFNPWDMDTIGSDAPRALSPFSSNYVHDFQYTVKSTSRPTGSKVRVTPVDCVLLNEQAAPAKPAGTGGAPKPYKSPAAGSLESMQRKK